MSCEPIREQLSDYLDGELGAVPRSAVVEHLRCCVPCRRLLRDLEELRRRTAEWDPEVQPARDLWPGVVARLAESAPLVDAESVGGKPPRGMRRWWLAAAAALLLGLAVPVIVERLDLGGPSAREQLQLEADRSAYERLVEAASIARATDGTLRPRRDLEELLAAQRGVLDPQVVKGLEEEAERLERAIGEIQLALEEAPDNRHLKLALAARYRQESQLLQRLGRV